MKDIPGAAMPHHDVQLRKGGRLFHMERHEDGFCECEVADGDLAFFLNAKLCLSEEVSLRDLMLLIERDDMLFATVSGCSCLDELLKEMRSDAGEDVFPDVKMLELGWSAVLCNGIVQHETQLTGRAGDGMPVGVEFASMAWLADLPLTLDDTVSVMNEKNPEISAFAARRFFTLQEVVCGVLEDLTLFGDPSGRRSMLDSIRRRLDHMEEFGDPPEVAAVHAEEQRRVFSCRLCGEDSRCACFGKPDDLCHSCFAQTKEN